jgi:hypothetical protein
MWQFIGMVITDLPIGSRADIHDDLNSFLPIGWCRQYDDPTDLHLILVDLLNSQPLLQPLKALLLLRLIILL